jgi:2-oxoglutarate dehydrogenase E1 component
MRRPSLRQSETWSTPSASPPQTSSTEQGFSAGAQAFIRGFRVHGYRRAMINPLAVGDQDAFVAELDAATYSLSLDDTAGYWVHLDGASRSLTASELYSYLQDSYCGSIALQSAHIRSAEQRQWLYAQMEARGGLSVVDAPESARVLSMLVSAEAFEQFHRTTYPNSKHFSLEGSESLVVLLRTIVESAAQLGVEDLVLGMPHRGRLNMMLNALEVPAKQLMSLYSANPDPRLGASDLKDHAGLSTRIETAEGGIRVLLAHNPSHLESVSPVVCGMARALQDRNPTRSDRNVLPVLVHGDASFSGQGIVTETLNMSQTRGYGTGGTVHLILNNQIGSTVSHPRDSRSTLFGADIARMIDAPILHVNADDPDAVVFAARLATDFRMRFGADIIIDHVGYRRYGHFGADDPTMTRPAMQRRILRHRSVVDLYAESLRAQGLCGDGDLERLKTTASAALNDALPLQRLADPKSVSLDFEEADPQQRAVISTAVPIARLQAALQRLGTMPRDFVAHDDIAHMAETWRSIADGQDRPVDWCLAENLAYASLLANGFNVRVSGLDVGRGSFFHRHHVWHEQATAADWQNIHIPLRSVADAQGYFSIVETPLSEEAVLGFEYGYTLQCGRDLVVWEAQFGDFVNNAQVIIDQFIASGESKWGYQSGLVVLLPHGHEGAGPEHSCAFLGRFLQLCAMDNMQVAMPSTSAQLYHLLRRQALMVKRKPLVVMTPKMWLHGHQPSYSRLADLAHDGFRPLLGEVADVDRTAVARVIVASGKVYYDLMSARSKAGLHNLPILRVEQLYPFPTDSLRDALAGFPHLREVVWAQEEAKNHGAWHLVRDQLEAALPLGVTLAYAGRPAAAATAVCNAARHTSEAHKLVNDALGVLRTI